MPIKNNILFIHIPKTGGTSIERLFDMVPVKSKIPCKESLYGSITIDDKLYELQHLTYSEADKMIDIDGAYSFAFVRNPFDRIVSEYEWLGKKYFSQFEDYCRFICLREGRPDIKCPGDESYDTDEYFHWFFNYTHYTPQYKFVYHNNKIAVDFLGRFENFQNDLKHVLDITNTEYDPAALSKKHNTTKHDHYSTYYTDKLIEMVSVLYKKDLDMFDYSFS